MLRLTNIVCNEVGLSLKDLHFQEGITYAIDSSNIDFNSLIADIMRGYYIPDSGSVYVTINGSTNNLISVDDSYIYRYNRLTVCLKEGVNLIDALTIKDNMMLLYRGYRNVKYTHLQKLLNMVHIIDDSMRVKSLSENEKYRVKLAQLLYMRPKLVICNMLFYTEQRGSDMEEVESLLCDVCKHIGATLVYMGDILNEDNYDVVMRGSSIVKERLV